MKIRALIVDDEPLARQRIRTLLEEDRDIEIAGECGDGASAVAAISALAPDLLFLDIQMPAQDGFAVLQALPENRTPAIVFVTAYDQYALRAFEVHALDYLLKPFDRERFRSALERARKQIEQAQAGELHRRLIALLDDLRPGRQYLDRLVIRDAGRVFFLSAAEIDWIEAAGNYIRLHVGKDSYLHRETMGRLESSLDPKRFARIHRSTIVNLERVKELQPWFRGDYMVILRDNTKLTLSRGYRDRLQV